VNLIRNIKIGQRCRQLYFSADNACATRVHLLSKIAKKSGQTVARSKKVAVEVTAETPRGGRLPRALKALKYYRNFQRQRWHRQKHGGGKCGQ